MFFLLSPPVPGTKYSVHLHSCISHLYLVCRFRNSVKQGRGIRSIQQYFTQVGKYPVRRKKKNGPRDLIALNFLFLSFIFCFIICIHFIIRIHFIILPVFRLSFFASESTEWKIWLTIACEFSGSQSAQPDKERWHTNVVQSSQLVQLEQERIVLVRILGPLWIYHLW